MAVSPQITGLKSWSNVGEALFGNDLNGNFSTVTARYNSHTHDEFPTKAGAETISGQWRFDAITLHGTGVTNNAFVGDVVIAHGKSLRFAANSGTVTKRVIQAYNAGIFDVVGVGADSAIALGVPATMLGANTGDVVLGNAKRLAWANGAGNGIVTVATIDSNNIVYLGSASSGLALAGSAPSSTAGVVSVGSPASLGGASAGDMAFANNTSLRWANAAGTSTYSALSLGADNSLRIDQNQASVVTLGGPASVSGAAVGDVVLANSKVLRFSNAAGSAALHAVALGADNHLYLGANGVSAIVVGSGTGSGASAGDLVLSNAKTLRWRNGANNGFVNVASVGASNIISIGGAANGLALAGAAPAAAAGVVSVGSPASLSGAAAGDVVLANNKALRFANAAGTSTLAALQLDAVNNVYVGGNGSSVVALGSPGSLSGAAAGDVVIANNKALRWARSGGGNSVPVLSLDDTNKVNLDLSNHALNLANATISGTVGSLFSYLNVEIGGVPARIPLYTIA